MDADLRRRFVELGEEVWADEWDDTDWDKGFRAGYWLKEAEKETYEKRISQLEALLSANIRVMKEEIRKEMRADASEDTSP